MYSETFFDNFRGEKLSWKEPLQTCSNEHNQSYLQALKWWWNENLLEFLAIYKYHADGSVLQDANRLFMLIVVFVQWFWEEADI